nr:hypothetical protein [Halomarina salina]
MVGVDPYLDEETANEAARHHGQATSERTTVLLLAIRLAGEVGDCEDMAERGRRAMAGERFDGDVGCALSRTGEAPEVAFSENSRQAQRTIPNAEEVRGKLSAERVPGEEW